MTLLAYRYALNPTPAQERLLRSHAGAARVAFNWGLARVKENLEVRATERALDIADADMTPSVGWSLYSLRKDWNRVKAEVAPWWAECSKEAFNTGLDQLARALKNWADSRKGNRKGKPVGFPKFTSKRKARPSIRFTTGSIRCEPAHAVLPRLGRIKLYEVSNLKDARIVSASVRFDRGRWFASFTAEQDIVRPAASRPSAVAGVDLAIKTLAVIADGTGDVREMANPPHLGRAVRGQERCGRCGGCPGRCRVGVDRIGVPGRFPRTGGGEPTKPATRPSQGSPTSGATACISSPQALPARMARSWSKTSTSRGSRGWYVTAAWHATFRTLRSVRSVASWSTRPPGVAAP